MKTIQIKAHSSLLTALFLLGGCSKTNIPQPTENLADKWSIYFPPETNAERCTVELYTTPSPSGQTPVHFYSDYPARFAITPITGAIAVVPGERYKLAGWVKGSVDSKLNERSPGIVLRATLFTEDERNYDKGHFYLGIKGVSTGAGRLNVPLVPTTWTRIEGIIEVPTGVAKLKPFVFCWGTMGSLYFDNFTIEKVPKDSPVSPLL